MHKDISKAIPRIDAADKVTGRAIYLDDIAVEDLYYARFVRSKIPRGRIVKINLPELPEEYTWVDANDVPGKNVIALIKTDWPSFAKDRVRFIGEIIGVLVGPDRKQLDTLLDEIEIIYEEDEAIYEIDDSIKGKGGWIVGEDNILVEYTLNRGNVDQAFKKAHNVIEGTYETGFQEHVYLEPQSIEGYLEGENGLVITGSMQCPYYVKHAVDVVIGGKKEIRVKQTLTGGGFGGKEDYPEIIGGPLAVAVYKTGKRIRIIYDRTEDLAFTTKRHPSKTTIKTAHDKDGNILGMDIELLLNGGAYESYSAIVLQRAIFTSNGAYVFPSSRVHGAAYATNIVPTGAFRGFGAPQAIFAIESHMNHVAEQYGIEPLSYKQKYFAQQGDPTITNGVVREEVKLNEMLQRLEKMSNYTAKRKQYENDAWKGIGLSVFNHGCGFTGDGEQKIIKARVQLKKDASDNVEILVSNIDMGQGLFTTFRKIVAKVLGLEPEDIEYRDPDTGRVPDSGPTVASRSIMVVGRLLERCAEELKETWKPGEAQTVETHYKMPEGMSWDQETLQGNAYPVFGWAVNAIEVEVDPDTYEVEVKGNWAVYDVGKAIDERIVEGQIQGGTIQCLGYAALEKMEVEDGMFKQRTLADYIIPTSVDFPRTHSETVDNPFDDGPFGAKGVGEIVHDGAHVAFTNAVEQAIKRQVHAIPLTPEKILEVMQNEN